MSDRLIDGDYVKENGALVQVDYIDEVLQNAKLLLKAIRGRFYPNKNFGSHIRENSDISAAYATAYARQALDSLDGVYVSSARRENSDIIIKLLINGEEREVSIALENNI